MTALPEALHLAQRCVVGFGGERGPLLAPMAFWSDDASLWMSTPAVSVKASALRARPACRAYVGPVDGGEQGLVVSGRARVYGLHDPVGLAVHGPTVSAAMAALAARNGGTILGYVRDARLVPARFRPHNRVAVRVLVDDVVPVTAPEPGPGVSPALPAVVPAGVRRALTGRRSVVLAAERGADAPVVAPAAWGAGYRLVVGDGVDLPATAPAAIHVGSDLRGRPTSAVGLTLAGRLDDGRLVPQRVTWWTGFTLQTVELAPRQTSAVVLPD